MGALRRALERRVGVQEFKFDIDRGTGTFTLEPGRKFDLAPIEEASREAGFRLVEVTLEVVGAISRTDGRADDEAYAIHVASADQRIYLGPGRDQETRKNYEAVRRHADGRTRLRVRGPAHGHVDAGPGMIVASFEVLGRGREGD